jgi:nitrogen regulatory protein PII
MIHMKLIVAIVRPYRLQEVKEALSKVGVTGLTVTEVRGVGKQKGQIERYRGSEYNVDLIAKCKIEIAVASDQAEEVIQAIRDSAYTGEIGDGKIFVLPLDDAMRIRTGERGEDSL